MDSTCEYQRRPVEAGPVLWCRQRGMSDAGNQGGGRVDRVPFPQVAEVVLVGSIFGGGDSVTVVCRVERTGPSGLAAGWGGMSIHGDPSWHVSGAVGGSLVALRREPGGFGAYMCVGVLWCARPCNCRLVRGRVDMRGYPTAGAGCTYEAPVLADIVRSWCEEFIIFAI